MSCRCCGGPRRGFFRWGANGSRRVWPVKRSSCARRCVMCELLGMSANVPTDIVFSFTGLMQRGGRTGPHRDGWGIGFYEGRGLRLFQDPRASSESEVAQLVQRYPIKSEVVIGHIRQANVGRVCLANTHTFVREMWGRNWCFAHNGQLADSAPQLDNYRPIRLEERRL